MRSRRLKNYSIHRGFHVTYNAKERTYTIYTSDDKYLSTVNEGELNSELDRLENDYYGAD